MIHPRDLSVTKKLTGMVAAAASVALLMACTGFTLFELRNYRYSAEKELSTIAQMIAGISTAALAFHDAKAAQETLATLRKEERIEAACIYTASGLQLAVYQRAHHPTAPPERPGSDGIAFSDTHVRHRPVGERAGLAGRGGGDGDVRHVRRGHGRDADERDGERHPAARLRPDHAGGAGDGGGGVVRGEVGEVERVQPERRDRLHDCAGHPEVVRR